MALLLICLRLCQSWNQSFKAKGASPLNSLELCTDFYIAFFYIALSSKTLHIDTV